MHHTIRDQPPKSQTKMQYRDNTVSRMTLSLSCLDFPIGYINFAHPLDYVPVSTPITPQFIVHVKGMHMRLIVRISWRSNDGACYIPMSFICDTGAPGYLYLSPIAQRNLDSIGRLKKNDLETLYVSIFDRANTTGFNAKVKDTPASHNPANIIGLGCLLKLGFCMGDHRFSFQKFTPFF